MDQTEAFAHDQGRVVQRRSAEPPEHPAEIRAMSRPPPREGTISLAFGSGEIRVDRTPLDEPHVSGLDDRDRRAIEQRHDAHIAGLRHRVSFRNRLNRQTGRRRLPAGEDQRSQLAGQRW